MPELSPDTLAVYLESLVGQPVRVIGLSPIGEPLQAGGIKGYGYGVPIQVEYEVSGKRHRAVVETIHPGRFGHQHMATGPRRFYGTTGHLTAFPAMSGPSTWQPFSRTAGSSP